jgi:hypothetical protein
MAPLAVTAANDPCGSESFFTAPLGCATFTQRHHAVAAALDKHLRPFLLGKDVQRIEDPLLRLRADTRIEDGTPLVRDAAPRADSQETLVSPSPSGSDPDRSSLAPTLAYNPPPGKPAINAFNVPVVQPTKPRRIWPARIFSPARLPT